MSIRRWITLAVIGFASTTTQVACNECQLVTAAEVRPTTETHTIGVGQSFTAEYWEGTVCLNGNRRNITTPVDVRWWTGEPNIVEVDAVTGRITGLAPGTARVWFRLPEDQQTLDNRLGEVLVVVQ
jgi:uncharacterized protein YjdB